MRISGKIITLVATGLAALICVNSAKAENVAKQVAIVPAPTSITYEKQGPALAADYKIVAKSAELAGLCQTFREVAGEMKMPKITLKLKKELAEEEYILESRKKGVTIYGGSSKGVWWGLQTLLQIAAQSEGRMPGLTVCDKPEFAYRGAMLDCSRHFFSVDDVKRWIDAVNLHKINVFHWHLTDDQGWRVEIKKYPLLTEVGAWRDSTLIGKTKQYDGKRYGGFYSQEEMKDIVAYAAARQMTIIPEIEMPGHSMGILAAYPNLGCTGEGYKVWTRWGISKDILCAGNPEVIPMLKDILDEVCEIFPSEFIHIGGDEAPRANWKTCPKCQALMKEKGFTQEAQLQTMINEEIERHLASKGRRIIGWDEILEGGASQSAVVMSWRGAKGGIAAAKKGNDVVMAPNSHFYLDYYQTKNRAENGEPLAIGGHLPLRKCYSFDPFDQLDEEQSKHILGIQANTWCEYIETMDHVIHMDFPRIAALSDINWSNSRRTSYEEFVERVRAALLPIYEARGYNYSDYAFRNPPVE